MRDHPAQPREDRLLEHLAAMHHAARIFESGEEEVPEAELIRYLGLMHRANVRLRRLCAWAFERKAGS